MRIRGVFKNTIYKFKEHDCIQSHVPPLNETVLPLLVGLFNILTGIPKSYINDQLYASGSQTVVCEICWYTLWWPLKLLSNGSVNKFPGNRYMLNNRRIVGSGVFFAVCSEAT
jgi:hypothetical protein